MDLLHGKVLERVCCTTSRPKNHREKPRKATFSSTDWVIGIRHNASEPIQNIYINNNHKLVYPLSCLAGHSNLVDTCIHHKVDVLNTRTITVSLVTPMFRIYPTYMAISEIWYTLIHVGFGLYCNLFHLCERQRAWARAVGIDKWQRNTNLRKSKAQTHWS